MHGRRLLCPDGCCVIPARADALFGLGIVTGTTPANGTQPDKHRRLFRSSALFDLNLTIYGRSGGFKPTCSREHGRIALAAAPFDGGVRSRSAGAAYGAKEPA